jgi:hypothetical protein
MVEDFIFFYFWCEKALTQMRENKNKNRILFHMFPDLLGGKNCQISPP